MSSLNTESVVGGPAAPGAAPLPYAPREIPPGHAWLIASCTEPVPRRLASFAGVGGVLKQTAEAFEVEEVPAYLPSGTGDHLYLWVQKRDVAAPAMLAALAQVSGVAERDVGVAGAKDAAAVTRQWVSLPASAEARLASAEATDALAAAGIEVLESRRHGNKLRCGHLRGNRFVLRVHGVDADRAEADMGPMLAVLAERGMPNFYGAQRFGRGGQNVARGLGWLSGARPPPKRPVERRFVCSAVQSALFNAYLQQRMADGLLDQVLLGEVMQVVRSGGPFWADDAEADQARYASGEIVPSGPMFGTGVRRNREAAIAREDVVLERAGVTLEDFARARKLASGTRRPLVVWPGELAYELDAATQTLTLRFVLPPGSYATVLAHELMGTDPA